MAKKKKKQEAKKKFAYSCELYGVLLILASILGLGKYGPVGSMIASFGLFLTGVGYNLFLVVLFIIGGYLVLKREWPNFFTTKLLGIYLFVIGVLVLMHKNSSNISAVFTATIDELVTSFNQIMKGLTPDITGGGIIGGGFALVFALLFSYQGMQIIAWVLVFFGIMLFTGFSIFDFVRNSIEKSKEALSSRMEQKEETSKKPVVDEEEENAPISGSVPDEDKRIIISSIDDLNKKPKEESHSLIMEDDEEEEPMPSQEAKDVRPVIIHNQSYQLPPITLLDAPKKAKKGMNQSLIEQNIIALENVLKDFGIIGKVVEVHVGPTVTQYELELRSGTKVSKLLGINREIALALATRDVRIEAPIPGKNTVGIELANKETTPVSFREIVEKIPKEKDSSKLLVPLGKNIMGNVIWCEIDKTPHLLVAGTTGSGKSVCINGIICSILMRAKPDEVKLVMVDPKVVELSVYNGIPHLLCPVVSDPKKASVALAKMVDEMERRYESFSETKTKSITTYNAYIDEWNKTHSGEDEKSRMPYIVIIIDELADLMMVAAKEVEASILRIAQKARAAGIHLVAATQRPSTDVITGLIKANIPSRISFAVGSSIDSRTILDTTGAEKLLGKGDMLFFPMGEVSPQRVQGAFISDSEIQRLIDYTIEQQKAEYDEKMLNLESSSQDKSQSQMEDMSQQEEYDDPLYNEIVEFVVETQKASASLLQRRFKLGYNRAARIVDLLEERGIIGPQNGSKPREVLVKLEEKEQEE